MSNLIKNSINWALFLKQPSMVYVPTPKVACTKLRALLIMLQVGRDDPNLWHFLNSTPAAFFHWEFGLTDNHRATKKYLIHMMQSEEVFRFAFVRNPYSRLVSIYNYRIRTPHLNGSSLAPVYSSYLAQYSKYIASQVKAHSYWNASDTIRNIAWRVETALAKVFLPPEIGASLFARNTSNLPLHDLVDNDHPIDYQAIEARMINSFRCIYHHQEYAPKTLLPVKVFRRLFGCPSADSLDLINEPVTFAEFVHYVCEQPHSSMDIHWQPQILQLGLPSTNYAFIGRVEQFQADASKLFHQVEAPSFIQKYLKGRLNASSGPADLWNKELADAVYQTYQNDFDAFEYERESWRQ